MDEQHLAVAPAQTRHLHRDRRAINQHDLVAPVELVGLARREAERHERLRYLRRAVATPATGVPPHRVVAVPIAQPAQRLEHPDQGQTLAAGLDLVLRQQPVQLLPPGAKTRYRLLLALILEVRRLGPDHLAHGFPRCPQIAAISGEFTPEIGGMARDLGNVGKRSCQKRL